MATRIWLGRALARSQVTTATPANVVIGDVFTLTVNGKSVSFTATAATVANVTAGLAAAWEAETDPAVAEITATDSTTHVTLTGAAGVPFTVSAGISGSANNEVQTVTITGSPTGGTFTLTYSGQTTAGIAYNADAATVDAALEALSNIGAGDVTCTGGPLPGTAVIVEFTGALAATNVAEMTASGAGLTGGSSPAVAIATTTAGSPADTLTLNTTTTASGPNNWDDAINWDGGAIPVDGDTVYVTNSAISILYGLDQTGVQLAAFHIDLSFTGAIGLPATNASQYPEYRARYLTIGADVLIVGRGEGNGSGFIRLNLDGIESAITVYNTGQRTENGRPSLIVTNAHADSTMVAYKGDIGIAVEAAQTSGMDSLKASFVNSASDLKLTAGGVTIATVDQAGGVVEYWTCPTALTATQGAKVTILDGACTTMVVDTKAEVTYRGNDTIATLTVNGTGIVKFTEDEIGRTVTNCIMLAGASLYDKTGSVTFTNGVDLFECGLADVSLDLGKHFTVSRSAI